MATCNEKRAENYLFGNVNHCCHAHLVVIYSSATFGVGRYALGSKVQQLSIKRLEELGEALLNFAAGADLERWLADHLKDEQ